MKTIYRSSLVSILEAGLSGLPILEKLEALFQEIKWASERDIEQQILRLPIIMLLPLLFL